MSWLSSLYLYEIDLNDFDLNKLRIEFNESFPSRIIEQTDIHQSIEEQALYHLYQDNMDAFNLCKQILEKKKEFNERMEIFIECIKKDLMSIEIEGN